MLRPCVAGPLAGATTVIPFPSIFLLAASCLESRLASPVLWILLGQKLIKACLGADPRRSDQRAASDTRQGLDKELPWPKSKNALPVILICVPRKGAQTRKGAWC